MARIDRNGWLNLTGGFLVGYGLVAAFCMIGLQCWWAGSAPHLPDPAHGQIVAHREHGVLRYYSDFQSTGYALLLLTSMPLCAIGMGITPRGALRRRGGKMKWDLDDALRLHGVGWRTGAAAAPALIFLLGPPVVHTLNAAGIVMAI